LTVAVPASIKTPGRLFGSDDVTVSPANSVSGELNYGRTPMAAKLVDPSGRLAPQSGDGLLSPPQFDRSGAKLDDILELLGSDELDDGTEAPVSSEEAWGISDAAMFDKLAELNMSDEMLLGEPPGTLRGLETPENHVISPPKVSRGQDKLPSGVRRSGKGF
jgi:hypothetical protein